MGGQMHQPHRLVGGTATRTSDASYRHGEIRAGTEEGTMRHLQRCLSGYRAEIRQRLGANAQHVHLGFIGIGDKTTVNDSGGAGNLRQGTGDQAARAAFRGRDHETMRGEIGNDPPRQLFYVSGKKAHKGLPL